MQFAINGQGVDDSAVRTLISASQAESATYDDEVVARAATCFTPRIVYCSSVLLVTKMKEGRDIFGSETRVPCKRD